MAVEQTLAGRVIAVPEARELDVFASLLERRGARALRCPLVSILDALDPAPVLAWLEWFCAGGADDLVLLTGEGLRRLDALLGRERPTLQQPWHDALARVRKTTRGPKPARALREMGLHTDLAAATPTTAGVIAALRQAGVRDRHVAVQLYGEDPNAALVDFLREAGAQVHPVAPYRYAGAADDAQVLEMIALLGRGAVDAIAFTSKAQVDRLFAIAQAHDTTAALCAGLQRCRVAAIGPVVREVLEGHGVAVALMPQAQFFLKQLTEQLARALGPRPA